MEQNPKKYNDFYPLLEKWSKTQKIIMTFYYMGICFSNETNTTNETNKTNEHIILVSNNNVNINMSNNETMNEYVRHIKDMRLLNGKMIEEIGLLNNEDKMRIILAYNDVFDFLNTILK